MAEEKTRQKAVALSFNAEKDQAPRVIAKGQGLVAGRIEEIARQAGVPIQEDRELVEYLSALDLYQEIPPFLYEVVAEILAYVYRVDCRQGERR